MRYLLFFLLFFIFSWSLYSSDIRDTNWGMTKNQVKKIEKEKLIGEDELTLRYFTIINKLEFKLEYEFRNDSLKKVLYTTTRSYNPDIQLNIFFY